MRPVKAILILSMLVLALFSGGSAAQTVLVEDFETPDTGNYATYFAGQFIVTATNTWAVTQNSVDLYEAAMRPEAGAFDGGQAVDLTGSPGEGVLETTFATTPGTEYELVFHYARNNYLGAETGDALVEVIGSGVVLLDSVQHDPAFYLFDEYQTFQATFVADAAQSILRFTGRDPGVAGITIDGISVTVVDPTGAGTGTPPVDGLLGVYPNPFNPAVTIDYVTSERGMVDARIYDTRGRLMHTLVDAEQGAGTHSLRWSGTSGDGARVASGVYFLVLTTARGTSSQRLVLLK